LGGGGCGGDLLVDFCFSWRSNLTPVENGTSVGLLFLILKLQSLYFSKRYLLEIRLLFGLFSAFFTDTLNALHSYLKVRFFK